jgi:hypothetical protein
VGTREFIASLVGSLAWPLTVAASLIALRRHIVALFVQLPKRLRAGPLEIEWDRTYVHTARTVDPPAKTAHTTPGPSLDTSDLRTLAAESPRAAVVEAAGRIEAELRTRLEDGGNAASSNGMRELARQAHGRGLISDLTTQNLEGLAILRNLAAHSSEEISADKATEFLDLAEGIVYQMNP